MDRRKTSVSRPRACRTASALRDVGSFAPLGSAPDSNPTERPLRLLLRSSNRRYVQRRKSSRPAGRKVTLPGLVVDSRKP